MLRETFNAPPDQNKTACFDALLRHGIFYYPKFISTAIAPRVANHSRNALKRKVMFTLRQMKTRLLKPIPLVSWGLASVLAGMSGPFQTSQALDQPQLTLYWSWIAAVSIVLGFGVVIYFDSNNKPIDVRYRAMVIALVFSAINTSFVLLTNALALPVYFQHGPPVWVLFLFSASIMFFVLLIRYFLTDRVEQRADIPFFKRLKPELGRDLVRLCGQDHYVEVCTENGKDMILMRFSDAMEELADFAGLRVHRSHWVSLAAIERVEKSGSKLKILMNDGSEVPVSRSYKPSIKDAGLL